MGTNLKLNWYFLEFNFLPYIELNKMDIISAFKFLVIFILVVILISLTGGLHFLIKDKDESTRLARSLTLRVILSVFLFVLLFFGYSMGWITPNFV